jgi:hypothetical protein
MSKSCYALFPSAAQAADAIAAVKALGVDEDHLSIMVHTDPVEDAQELGLSETEAAPGVVRGALMGALAGVLGMSLVVLPFGLIGAGPLAAAATGTVGGGAWGALGAGLSGLGFARQGLEHLIDRMVQGQILVTITGAHRAEAEEIEEIFRRNRAVEVHVQSFLSEATTLPKTG